MIEQWLILSLSLKGHNSQFPVLVTHHQVGLNDKIRFFACVSSEELQLINRETDCFVNSVVQLIRNTVYVPYIRAHLPMLMANSPEDSYKLSKRLSYIYSENSVGQPKSTAFIRTHVAHMSGKHYLDNKTQQDAEEFMRTIEIVLSEELIESEEFKVSRDLHLGKRRNYEDVC